MAGAFLLREQGGSHLESAHWSFSSHAPQTGSFISEEGSPGRFPLAPMCLDHRQQSDWLTPQPACECHPPKKLRVCLATHLPRNPMA